jgi:hypothetical protein
MRSSRTSHQHLSYRILPGMFLLRLPHRIGQRNSVVGVFEKRLAICKRETLSSVERQFSTRQIWSTCEQDASNDVQDLPESKDWGNTGSYW